MHDQGLTPEASFPDAAHTDQYRLSSLVEFLDESRGRIPGFGAACIDIPAVKSTPEWPPPRDPGQREAING
jgi:hypothetical protein